MVLLIQTVSLSCQNGKKILNLYICNVINFDAEFYHLARFVVTCKESLMADPTFTSVLDINKNILQNEVIKVIHKAECGKMVGLDSIPCELLKHKICNNFSSFVLTLIKYRHYGQKQ